MLLNSNLIKEVKLSCQ